MSKTVTVDALKLFDLFGLAAAFAQVNDNPKTLPEVKFMLDIIGMNSEKIDDVLEHFGSRVLNQEYLDSLKEETNV